MMMAQQVLKSILSAPYRAPDCGRLELNAYEIRNISHSFIIYLYQFESWPNPIANFSNKKPLSTFSMYQFSFYCCLFTRIIIFITFLIFFHYTFDTDNGFYGEGLTWFRITASLELTLTLDKRKLIGIFILFHFIPFRSISFEFQLFDEKMLRGFSVIIFDTIKFRKNGAYKWIHMKLFVNFRQGDQVLLTFPVR